MNVTENGLNLQLQSCSLLDGILIVTHFKQGWLYVQKGEIKLKIGDQRNPSLSVAKKVHTFTLRVTV